MGDISLTAFKYAESSISARKVFAGGDPWRRIRVAWLFYLLRTEGRNILVDTGVGRLPTIIMAGFLPRRFTPPLRLLRAYGLVPAAIDEIIVTHAHFDHVGDLELYPRAIIVAQEEEASRFKGRLRDPGRVRTFGEAATVHGSIELRRSGGHTRGHAIALFEAGGRRQVIGGDECYILENLDRGILPGVSADPVRSRAFIEEFARPACQVWLSHEPSVVPGGLGWRAVLSESAEQAPVRTVAPGRPA